MIETLLTDIRKDEEFEKKLKSEEDYLDNALKSLYRPCLEPESIAVSLRRLKSDADMVSKDVSLRQL